MFTETGFQALYPLIRSSQESQKVILWLKSGVESVGKGRPFFFLSNETFGTLSQADISYSKIFRNILVLFLSGLADTFFKKAVLGAESISIHFPDTEGSLKAVWSSTSCLG